MPKTTEVLRGLDFEPNRQFGPFTLNHVEASETTVRRNQEYTYTLFLYFNTPDHLIQGYELKDLERELEETPGRVITTGARATPYNCEIEDASILAGSHNTVTFFIAC